MIKLIILSAMLLSLSACATNGPFGDNKWINCQVHAIKRENCQ